MLLLKNLYNGTKLNVIRWLFFFVFYVVVYLLFNLSKTFTGTILVHSMICFVNKIAKVALKGKLMRTSLFYKKMGQINMRKENVLWEHSLQGEIAASVLLKLFIRGIQYCHTTSLCLMYYKVLIK